MGKEGERLNLIGPICHSRLTLPTSVYESFSNLPIGPNVPTAWEGSRLRAPGETSQAELTSKGRPGVRLRVHHRKPRWPLAGIIAPENPGARDTQKAGTAPPCLCHSTSDTWRRLGARERMGLLDYSHRTPGASPHSCN